MTALAALGQVCDLRRAPWDYPGPRPPHAGLLAGGRYHRLTLPPGAALAEARLGGGGPSAATLDAALRRRRVAPLAARTAVVAVGSNASPAVMRAKLARAGASGVLMFVPARVTHLGVGHSAHVSRAGYVAATPFRRRGARAEVVVSLLDDEQLACLDRTERTYTRRVLGAPEAPLRLDGSGEEPARYWLYDSDRGVVAGAPGSTEPLGLTSQAAVLRVLLDGDARLRRLLGPSPDPRAVLPALAASAGRREEVRRVLAAAWALASGLAQARGSGG